MTDGEKKAIDDLFSLTHINGYINLYDQEKANIYTSNLKRWQNGVKVLLNLMQTQQEEIDLYNETEIALNNRIMDLEAEIEKKDTLINTMQAEFERLENLEDNTDMLKEELKKKDKIIDNSINEIEKIRQYFSEDLQVEFIRILEILKDKKVIDW